MQDAPRGFHGWRIFATMLGGILVIGLGIYNAASPVRAGSARLALSRDGIVESVAPSSPAFSAGVRVGDRLAKMPSSLPLSQRISQEPFTRAGIPRKILLRRLTRTFSITIVPSRIPDFRAGRYADLFVELGSVVLACLVLVRTRRGPLTNALVGYTFWIAVTMAAADAYISVPTSEAAFALNGVAQMIAGALQMYFVFRLVGLFPPESSPARRMALLLSPIAFIAGSAPEWAILGKVLLPTLGRGPAEFSNALIIIINVAGFAILLWSLLHVGESHRVRMRWFASTLLVFQFLATALQGLTFFVPALAMSTVFGLALFYLTNLGPIGPIYAILRHKMLDLDVVISRSAIYGALSVTIVALFIAAEWIAGKLADLVVGQSLRGVATQALSFAIAIAVGLSVRQMHGLIERRVNAIFFRARMKRLASLERFALEADLSDSPHGLLGLTFQTVRDSIESPGVSIFIADGHTFSCVHSTDADAPRYLDKNDRLILRLLRWPEPFVVDEKTLRDWFVIPLMVRTTVLGFIACAPKSDHTPYLADEMQALTTLAHHVATSYAFMSAGDVLRQPVLQPTPA